MYTYSIYIFIIKVVDFDYETRECVEWLQINIAPWGDVIEKWHKTYEIRKIDLAALEDRSLAKIFDKWSTFKHPQGHELIDIDFKNMNLTKVELSFDIWLHFFNVIQEEQTISTKDYNVQLMLEQVNDKNVTAGTKKIFLNLNEFLSEGFCVLTFAVLV